MDPSIIICDDNTVHREYLAHLLKECPPWNEWPIKMFSSACELLKQQDNFHPHSILLMDICLKNENGIEVVGKLQIKHPDISVIYITGEIFYCTDVYDTNHCGFLLKPVVLPQLQHALWRTQNQVSPLKSLCIKVGRKVICIQLNKILYFEKQLRKIVIVTHEESLDFYGKFEDLMPQLDRRMIRCHNSFIVNMDYIQGIIDCDFLISNKKIPISKKRLAEVRSSFLHYFHEKNNEEY